MSDTQREEIEALVRLLDQHQLTELEIEKKGVRVRIRRDPAPIISTTTTETLSAATEVTSPDPVATVAHPDQARFITVTSPIVGTFYRSPSPDADAYIEEGDFVKKGQVLCIVEAMKLMNEIEAETDGRIMKILLDNTTPVEYGQPLLLIDPVAGS